MEFSPPIQYWYDRIHAYPKLISIKKDKGKYVDVSRAVRSARRKGIKEGRTNRCLKTRCTTRYIVI